MTVDLAVASIYTIAVAVVLAVSSVETVLTEVSDSVKVTVLNAVVATVVGTVTVSEPVMVFVSVLIWVTVTVCTSVTVVGTVCVSSVYEVIVVGTRSVKSTRTRELDGTVTVARITLVTVILVAETLEATVLVTNAVTKFVLYSVEVVPVVSVRHDVVTPMHEQKVFTIAEAEAASWATSVASGMGVVALVAAGRVVRVEILSVVVLNGVADRVVEVAGTRAVVCALGMFEGVVERVADVEVVVLTVACDVGLAELRLVDVGPMEAILGVVLRDDNVILEVVLDVAGGLRAADSTTAVLTAEVVELITVLAVVVDRRLELVVVELDVQSCRLACGGSDG